MKEDAHMIRKPQFLIRDGPGSLIETLNETRLIFNMAIGYDGTIDFNESFLKNYEINDPRLLALLSRNINQEIKIFDILTNEMLNKSSMEVIYNTKRFPRWYICHKKSHTINNRPIKSILFRPNSNNQFSCPICHSKMSECTSVRFVMACPDGHLDDINWYIALHDRQLSCKKKSHEEEIYEWEAYSTNLGSINIRCPYCNDITKTMKEIFYHPFKCSGLYQERFKNIPPSNTGCGREMKVIQKNSSALRLTSIMSFLEIPKYRTALGNLFRNNHSTSQSINTIIKHAFKFILEDNARKKMILQIINTEYFGDNINEIIQYINATSIQDIVKEVNMLFNANIRFIDCINEEFETLLESKISGDFFEKDQFQLINHSIKSFPGLKICKVNLLQTITVQKGYRRVPYTKDSANNIVVSKVVDIGEQIGAYIWYPAFRSLGEGIFITFTEGDEDFQNNDKYINRNEFLKKIQKKKGLNEDEKSIIDAWSDYSCDTETTEGVIVDWSSINNEPLFVWLHTLSHTFIKNISMYAGYNSASLKERIYVNKDKNGKVINGGILIYVTSLGNDGGMGSLTQLTDVVSDILKNSVEALIFCSNDPLCDEKKKELGMKNGAGCHSCLLISETSCEHRNYYLDRHLITRLK